MRPVTELRDCYAEDIYIIGSGPTVDYIDECFFRDKIDRG